MPYTTNKDLPDSVFKHLPAAAQTIFRKAFNAAYHEYPTEEQAFKVAWAAVKKAGYKKGTGDKWIKKTTILKKTTTKKASLKKTTAKKVTAKKTSAKKTTKKIIRKKQQQ